MDERHITIASLIDCPCDHSIQSSRALQTQHNFGLICLKQMSLCIFPFSPSKCCRCDMIFVTEGGGTVGVS